MNEENQYNQENMMKKFIILLLFSLSTAPVYAFENLVYTVRGFPDDLTQGRIALQDLKKHATLINILSSQAYSINDKGVVLGTLNPQMVQIAKQAHIKQMPLVTNTKFDAALVHTFLNDETAQDRAIQSLLMLCKNNHFEGIQIDFEGMSFLDKEAFTQFYQNISNQFHTHGFSIAIAIIPVLTGNPPETDYLRGRYEKWTGVYDYKALGESSDFVTLMAYDHHGGITPPGPMAGIIWDEAIIEYALKFIPPEKISLGTPWRAGYWYTGRNISPGAHALGSIEVDLTYEDAMRLLNDNHVTLQWNDEDKVHFAIYRNHFLYEHMYLEDVDSFRAKVDLVTKYKLRGVSNWCLGGEDPRIWDLLAKLSKN